MSWWKYVQQVAGADSNSPKAMSAQTQIDSPHFSKWKTGPPPGAKLAAQFARGYRRPVLEAFVAAGFLTAEEAKERPAGQPDYTKLSNDELLELVRARMKEGGGGDADDPAPHSEPAPSPGKQLGISAPKGRRVTGRVTGPRQQSRPGARQEDSD